MNHFFSAPSSRYTKLALAIEYGLNSIVSGFVLLSIMLLIGYLGYQIFQLSNDLYHLKLEHFVHNIAYIIVIVKAYRVLLSYFKTHHLSIKYLLEIAIAAPMIEVIFAFDHRELSMTIMLAVFSLASLIAYLVFTKTIHNLEAK